MRCKIKFGPTQYALSLMQNLPLQINSYPSALCSTGDDLCFSYSLIYSPNLLCWVDLVPTSRRLWRKASLRKPVQQHPERKHHLNYDIYAENTCTIWGPANCACKKYLGRRGLGCRSSLTRLCSPASGSAEQHLPFPHRSAPVYRSISTGDARRLKLRSHSADRDVFLKRLLH